MPFIWPLKQSALCGTLLLIATQATAANCENVALSSSAGFERSQWREFSASGIPLVKETGTLLITRLDAFVQCSGVEWHIRLAQAQGQRRYQGMTNTQQSASTTTDLHDQSIQWDAFIPLNANWSGGLGIGHHSTHRNIHSTEQASGYPEKFSQWTGLAGLRYSHPVGEASTLAATVWAGRTFTGQVWLDVPSAEPTRLSLGGGRVFEASMTWAQKKTVEHGWSRASTLIWRSTQTASGRASALVNNGRLVGSALQPQTKTQTLGLSATMKYAF